MWSEYADRHAGVMIRIEPNLAKDSKFKLFRPVVYRETRPPLYQDTLEFIADSLFGDLQTRVRLIVDNITYTKTLNWAHENEYRLAIPLRPNEDPWNTLPYEPEEITELYLGRAMVKTDIGCVIGFAKAINPNVAIFRPRPGPDGSRFERV